MSHRGQEAWERYWETHQTKEHVMDWFQNAKNVGNVLWDFFNETPDKWDGGLVEDYFYHFVVNGDYWEKFEKWTREQFEATEP